MNKSIEIYLSTYVSFHIITTYLSNEKHSFSKVFIYLLAEGEDFCGSIEIRPSIFELKL